jgi:predicted nucleic acid-binding protein
VRILLDTNVVLDVALAREPFCQAAQMILDASDFRRVHLFITASSATDLYYVLRKEKGRDIGLKFIRRLLEGIDACGVDQKTLIAALNSDFLDFEDAVQNAAAIDARIDAIVTRNKADYRTSPLAVMSPDEFVAAHLA